MFAALLSVLLISEPAKASDDTQWTKNEVTLKGTSEAAYIVRVGDVDNLGFGWPEDFDPFCARMSSAHEFPWEPKPTDVPGLDRILLSSKFNPEKERKCGGDGYSGSFDPKKTKPVPIKLPLASVKDAQVANAYLQLFIDDFQAPSMCSNFRVELNGRRFVEAEKVLNAIDQTGPVGKLVTIPIPEEFHTDLTSKSELVVSIDETNGEGDGFALDFARLLVNRKRETACKGTVRGLVLQKEGDAPIPNATVRLADGTSAQTDKEGRFVLKDVPSGFAVLVGSAPGFEDGTGTADVGPGGENEETFIHLEKGKSLVFENKTLKTGDALSLNNILFDQGKADLKKESKPELDKIVQFLKTNATAEIELSGHTSSEGDAQSNRSLSYRRVKACKDYITAAGIDPGRVLTVGHGPDRPVASNDTEAGRKQNRRVEMRLIRD